MLLLFPIQEMGANKYKRDKAPGEDHSSEVIIKDQVFVTSLMVQSLGLQASTAGGRFEPGQEKKILHATWHSQKNIYIYQVAAY